MMAARWLAVIALAAGCDALFAAKSEPVVELDGETLEAALAAAPVAVDRAVADAYGVRGYPHVKCFRSGRFVGDYEGPNEAAPLARWAKRRARPAALVVGVFARNDSDAARRFASVANLEDDEDRVAFALTTRPDLVAEAAGHDFGVDEFGAFADAVVVVEANDGDDVSVLGVDDATPASAMAAFAILGAADLHLRGLGAASGGDKSVFDADDLLAFEAAMFAGELEPWLRSEPMIGGPGDARRAAAAANAEGRVVELSGKSFAAVVDFHRRDPASDADFFVLFHAPWCGHCASLAPTWEAARLYAPVDSVVVARMDATKNEIDDPGVLVDGFPTIYLFPPTATPSPRSTSTRTTSTRSAASSRSGDAVSSSPASRAAASIEARRRSNGNP
ncbi:hypothetical protein JL722_13849 [Aureococcus anophagefferens]|nr:hypothetical protein JL722_13849 [Aureococcus anophagefferens]